MTARDDYAKLDANTRGPHHQGQTSCEAQQALDEIDRLRAELAREEAAHARTCDDRDRAEQYADALALAVCPLDVLGEHSNLNNPWANALAYVNTPMGGSPA